MSTSVHVFTSAAANYLPKVRVLMRSMRAHHPEFRIHLALADTMPPWIDANAEGLDSVIPVEELDIPQCKAWIFSNSLIELSTAIKPFVMRKLFAETDADVILYFDPDIVLFSKIDDLVDVARRHNVALTPHVTTPEVTTDAILDNEVGSSLLHGVFNLGFIGIRRVNEVDRFLDWWAHRLYHFCRDARSEGVFTDQKWMNLAPVFFDDVYILKSSRFNVATWNLTTRQLEGSPEDGLTVDGEPVGFYHFTGFDSGDHHVMAAKNAPQNATAKSLIRWYEQQIQTESADDTATPWGYARFSNGEIITRAHRLIYRLRRDLHTAFPDPFQVTEARPSYYQWFRERARREHPDLVKLARDRHSATAPSTLWPVTEIRPLSAPKLRAIARQALSSSNEASRLLKRGAQIVRSEGIAGLRRRLGR